MENTDAFDTKSGVQTNRQTDKPVGDMESRALDSNGFCVARASEYDVAIVYPNLRRK